MRVEACLAPEQTQGRNNLNRNKKYTEFRVPDLKSEGGLWLTSYQETTASGTTVYKTRSGRLWKSIKSRTKVGGSAQSQNPSYIGSANMFEDFQHFAEWCQDQHGYMNKDEKGNFWHLDKDILVRGSKIYSPETCCFVPERVNNLVLGRRSDSGDWPLGVNWHKIGKKFRVECGDGTGKMEYLGLFEDVMVAHQAWQRAKIKAILNVAEDQILSERVRFALVQIAAKIKQDVDNVVETISF